ncbi:hypothetical protein [Flavobacterium sp.]|uniref:hypothetical protein n=1 Tax=Flavobacterium sp. TaxID=239 RepID=UPI00391DA407
MNATEGRIVTFTPSERTKKKFKNKQKDTYPAIITEVNKDSVDLTVFGVREEVHISNVKNLTKAEEGRSFWDWPVRQ